MPALPSERSAVEQMRDKIYITGMGAVTPVGIGADSFWKGIVSGKSGIGEITKLDTSALPIHRAGEVRDFNPKEHLPMRLVMDLEPYMQYAYVAAREAVEQSGLDTRSNRVGIVMGTALSGIKLIGETGGDWVKDGKSAGPKFLVKAMGNIAPAQFAINHGIKGPSMTVSTACSSGGDAIMLASMLICSGEADAVVVMAGEAAVSPALIQSLTKTGALSKTGECRPFDEERNGFVMGEGGAAAVLERADYAAARGAEPLAELLGCGNNTDAFNPVSPDPEGTGAAACMKRALENAGLQPEDIGYINAHGTATAAGDLAEALAIRRVFGDMAVPVSSTKGATGHMMGAGGIAEVIACVQAVRSGVLPPNTGGSQPEELGLHIVMASRKKEINAAMSNAMGFGGQNSCVIVGKVMESVR